MSGIDRPFCFATAAERLFTAMYKSYYYYIIIRVWFYGGVIGDGESNGAISGWIKSKMATGGHFEELQMAITQQLII